MLSTTNQVKPNGNCKPRSARCSKSFHQRLNRNFRCQAAQETEDWVTKNVELLRATPLIAGALGVSGVLANRISSGIAPVVTASSSQSRTDVLVIVLSAVLLLTGLQWLSLKPKTPVRVEPLGKVIAYMDPDLAADVVEEVQWAWQAVSTATRARSMVVFFRGKCIIQLGFAAESTQPGAATPGPICQQAIDSGRGNYLANLVLFPGRLEFAGYLPSNTQAALIQPVGKTGVIVVGGDTQRGFSRLDQAWVSVLADKLEVSFEGRR